MNVGWMTAYRGLTGDQITGGGGYVRKHGTGGEIFNFQPYRGRCYGYGRPANDRIAIERLGAPSGAEFLDGVLVVWVANSKVVGWFKNARLFRDCQEPPVGANRVAPHVDGAYYATAKASGCTVLQPDARTLNVPRAKAVDGGMGRYVWYAEGSKHKPFLKRLLRFIDSGGRLGKQRARGGGGHGRQSDPRIRKKVEEAAVREVIRYYQALGYRIHDRQSDRCGWDLEATTHGTVLYLEIKGCAGPEIGIELTANEFRHMQKHKNRYRVCIVTSALMKKPKLSIYGYVHGSKQWEHHEDGTPIQVQPVTVTTARLYC